MATPIRRLNYLYQIFKDYKIDDFRAREEITRSYDQFDGYLARIRTNKANEN